LKSIARRDTKRVNGALLFDKSIKLKVKNFMLAGFSVVLLSSATSLIVKKFETATTLVTRKGNQAGLCGCHLLVYQRWNAKRLDDD